MIKTIDEMCALLNNDYCGKSQYELLKEWGDSIVESCVDGVKIWESEHPNVATGYLNKYIESTKIVIK